MGERVQFSVSAEPLDCATYGRLMINAHAGALVSFEGRVRSINHGRDVVGLFYEAHERLAQVEFSQIVEETKNQFGIIDMRAVHRVGHLSVGESGVWLGVLAEHRQEAFLASAFAMRELKSRLPIWKKESYADGTHRWVDEACGCV